MASPGVSSDEGEIREATPLPRPSGDGDVDRRGRTPGKHSSRTPDDDEQFKIDSGSYYRDVSPRGLKRYRDEHEHHSDKRPSDPRRFRVHYESEPRDDARRERLQYDDRDRPPSSDSRIAEDIERTASGSSTTRFRIRDEDSSRQANARRDERHRHRGSDKGHTGYPGKRQRNRSRSPRDRRDNIRRDRVDNQHSDQTARASYRDQASSIKYSAHDETHLHRSSGPKHARQARASEFSQRSAKSGQGASDDSNAQNLRSGEISDVPAAIEPEEDWDSLIAVDKEAVMEAEISRRRRAREEAYKRGLGAITPTIQSLQVSEAPAVSTPTSTNLNTPLRSGHNTPAGRVIGNHPLQEYSADIYQDITSPGGPIGGGQDAMSPALNIASDQELINVHGEPKATDEDGPSAADYDPTADMKEDELRDEMRHGNVGLHAQNRLSSQVTMAVRNVKGQNPDATPADQEEEFDMFADDFEDKYAPPKSSGKAQAAEDGENPQVTQANGGGILEGDDKDGYYKIRPGEILDGRYQVHSTLGRGMFSGVARALNIMTQRPVAIKIMRNNDALRKGGFTEIAILQKLNDADPDNKKHIVKFERSFEYRGHLCMAFENLSLNLREVLKKFGNNVGINLNATRAYAYQIFLALGHMRKCSIIHADLKPDNILVNENRNVLKICDLGTAIDRSDAATAHNEITPYLVSRFYRAPEIILGMPYDYSIDMWSIGCTLYELYTGKILFTGDSNNQMLKTIMEIRGKLSMKLYRRGQLSNMHFDDLGNFVSVERDKVLGKTNIRTLAVIRPTRDLRTRLLAASSGMTDSETRELNHFADLLDRCLALNPDKRMTPSEALKHPFFTQRLHASGRGG